MKIYVFLATPLMLLAGALIFSGTLIMVLIALPAIGIDGVRRMIRGSQDD